MILQFKEEQYGWGDTFYILDENNQRKYRVSSSQILWNKKFEIRDMDKNVLVTIKNEPKSLLKKKFYIFIGDRKKAAITKEISLIPKFTIEGLDWQMRGVMQHEYEMLSKGQEVLSFHIESTKWGERPVLNITDSSKELLALAVVLTISYITNIKENEDPAEHV